MKAFRYLSSHDSMLSFSITSSCLLLYCKYCIVCTTMHFFQTGVGPAQTLTGQDDITPYEIVPYARTNQLPGEGVAISLNPAYGSRMTGFPDGSHEELVRGLHGSSGESSIPSSGDNNYEN